MKLILVRHGQSQWNLENRFTGWQDVDLTEQGIEEAKQAGKLIVEKGFKADVAYSSVLTRANKTLYHILNQSSWPWIPVIKSWRLNERNYGGLTGLNKAETAEKYGEDQVFEWRRSYRTCPPEMTPEQAKALYSQGPYDEMLTRELPLTENLEMTVERVYAYWLDEISPQLLSGKDVLVVAHGNSLRALTKIIEEISDEDINKLEIGTGVPIVYDFDDQLNWTNKEILEK